MATEDIERARWTRDLWRCGLAAVGFAIAHRLSGGQYNVFLVALVVFPITLFAWRGARKLGIETADDMIYEQEPIPDDLPKSQRDAMFYRQSMQRIEARQRDSGRLVLWGGSVLFGLLGLAALIKAMNGH